ncbi:hypothetical protein F5I97DRAFT_1928878 [Phlebopus sp. FC_14]|nr:hypothetical protein F5I97DRAFT_1928878 [Phlebopus sp. FC_14]
MEDDWFRNGILSHLHRKGSSPATRPEDNAPDGWVKINHPDTGVYYFHEEKSLCTTSNVLISRVRDVILEAAHALRSGPALRDLLEDQEEVGLVLNAEVEDGRACSYYFVSHGDRRVFWLEDVDVPCIEAQYWKHCEWFPTTLVITKDITGDLKEVLIQASGDRITSKFSTSPYSKDDLAYMLNLVKEIEGDTREVAGHSSWVIAKFMSLHNDGVLRSSYGQSDDYFDIDYTEPSIGPYQRSWLMAILAPFLLKSPDVFAEELYSFHDNFNPVRWSKFVRKVDMNIRDSNLLATVLLSTSVGFLQIGSIDQATQDGSRSAVQIVVYVSIVCSVGSIIIGLAIFKQYRAKGADTPLRAVTVLKRILKETYGLERLAIICSLPYVLLMWRSVCLIAFLGAFAIVFCDKTDDQVRVPVSIALFIVFTSLFSCLHTAGPPDKEAKMLQNKSYRERAIAYFPKWGTTDVVSRRYGDAEK